MPVRREELGDDFHSGRARDEPGADAQDRERIDLHVRVLRLRQQLPLVDGDCGAAAKRRGEERRAGASWRRARRGGAGYNGRERQTRRWKETEEPLSRS